MDTNRSEYQKRHPFSMMSENDFQNVLLIRILKVALLGGSFYPVLCFYIVFGFGSFHFKQIDLSTLKLG